MNCPAEFANEVCQRMLDIFPEAEFSMVWYQSVYGTYFKLRSRDDREDVAKIAEQFGGGGRHNTAAFFTREASQRELLKAIGTPEWSA